LDEGLQVLKGKKLEKGKIMSAEEGKFNVLVVAKGTAKVVLGFGVTDPAINVGITLLGCNPLKAFSRGGRRCHDRWVIGANK